MFVHCKFDVIIEFTAFIKYDKNVVVETAVTHDHIYCTKIFAFLYSLFQSNNIILKLVYTYDPNILWKSVQSVKILATLAHPALLFVCPYFSWTAPPNIIPPNSLCMWSHVAGYGEGCTWVWFILRGKRYLYLGVLFFFFRKSVTKLCVKRKSFRNEKHTTKISQILL